MPPEYVTPGVFVEEVSFQPPAIGMATTGVTAFLGAAGKGKCYQAFEIKSLTEFIGRFGALQSKLELGHAVSQFFANGGKVAWVVRVPRKFTTEQWQRGLAALDKVAIFDLLVVPGVDKILLIDHALSYAQSRKVFLILDSPKTATDSSLMRHAESTLPVSADAAVYFPWIITADPASTAPGAVRQTAPSGSVAGIMARTAERFGVWKAPAGNEAVVKGAVGLTATVNSTENELLNPIAVNCLREFPGKGRIVYGARTRAGGNANASEWKYIPIRRLALLLEKSIERGLQWAVFEPNDENLWNRIRRSAEDFLNKFWRDGAFAGAKAQEAFFVKCGRDTMTADEISTGIINIVVGFAALKPAEFLIIKLTLRTQVR